MFARQIKNSLTDAPSCDAKESEEKNPASILYPDLHQKVNGLYSVMRPILRPSFVEIRSEVFA